jgi:hypothetical protein
VAVLDGALVRTLTLARSALRALRLLPLNEGTRQRGRHVWSCLQDAVRKIADTSDREAYAATALGAPASRGCCRSRWTSSMRDKSACAELISV